jgi:TolB-like protein
MNKLKALVVFFIILFIAWTVTYPKQPKKAPPPPKITRRKLPMEAPYDFPENYILIHQELQYVFNEVSSSFTGNNVPVLVMPIFTMSTGGTPVLLTYITESAYAHLSKSKNIRIVKRDYNKSKSRIKSKYILIGRLSPVGDQIRVSIRIENINTGEIIDVFDEYIARDKASVFL